MGKLRTYFSIFILFWTACAPLNPDAIRIDETIDVSTDEPTRASATEAPAEASVIVIPLTDPIAIRDAEISGLAWYGDYLVLLPQYPNIFTTQEDGYIFALPKSEIIAFLGGESTEPLDPIQIPFIAPGLRQDIAGFEGYEAIAFDGNNVYVTIEAWAPDIMRAYLLTGTISPDLSSLTLDTTTQLTIGAQSDIGNMSDETLLFADGSLLTIYEANGAAVNEIPVAHVFNGDLTQSKTTSFPNIEYRTTDATALDADNRFWVINYYFPNEGVLLPDVDPIAELYGQGITHKQYDHVERLIELEYSESGIQLVERPPIQLELIDAPRNWEGIVRLENRGFLIVTDKWPETILGFVAK